MISDGGTVTIAVRPEWLDLWPPGEAPAGENTLEATVQDVIYLGETMHVRVALRDGTSVYVALRNEGQLLKPLRWRAGDACLVGWLPEDCQVLEG
jgi:ABC-type Fe3+/spermidine/putrescine transport system ATPase subunit